MSNYVKMITVVDTCIDSIKVLVIPVLNDNYSYIILSKKQAIVVDPSEFDSLDDEIEKRNVNVSAILITHEHHDHTGGVKKLYKKYKSQVIAAKSGLVPFLTREIVDGDIIQFDNITFTALSVPGHYSLPYLSSSIFTNYAWYSKDAGVLFTGDTLFSCGYGYITSGNERLMFESLKKLRELPDETLMFCGHEYTLKNTTFAVQIDPDNAILEKRLYEIKLILQRQLPTIPTKLGLEKVINPFLRWDDPIFKDALGIEGMGDFESFLHIRALKNEFNKSH